MLSRQHIVLKHSRRLINLQKTNFRDATRVPLSEPISIPSLISTKSTDQKYEPSRNTQITKLSNGLRVVTESNYGDFVTLGVAIESGCRFENGFPFGISRIVEKLAYSGSFNYLSIDDVYAELEKSGGIIDCQSTRDTFMYAASCHRSGVDKAVDILASSIWQPIIHEDDVENAKLSIKYENEDMLTQIEPIEMLLTDYIHQAAFQHNTLGFPKLVLADTVKNITEKHVYSYLSRFHSPDRMVIGGVGVDHQELVRSVEKSFILDNSTWNQNPDCLLSNVPSIDNSLAQYTGGELRKDVDLSVLTIGRAYPLLAHVVLGFQGCSFTDPDFVPFCVLQSLLGGGGAFSAGGPGKGMYARLYTEVMNRNHWVYSAVAQNHSYRDAGLFTISASCPPEGLNHALVVILDQFLNLLRGVDKQELERAKTQLRSHLMMNLEVRPVAFEDMVRQVLGHDVRKQPQEYAERIAKVTNKDIIRIAERMLSSKPSLVGYGDNSKLAKFETLDEAVAKRSLKPLL